MNTRTRPNILLVMSDEHDPAVTGCYGHRTVRTPAMDRLAERGVVFDNAYTNSPMCVPARNSFMTGRYVHEIDAWDNGSPMPAEVPTMGSLLEAAGYETVLCGRTHFVGRDSLRGWGKRLLDDLEFWKHIDSQVPRRTAEARRGSRSHVTACGAGEHFHADYDRAVAELAVRFLQSRADQPSERPFLLYAGFVNPHFPLVCPEEFLGLYNPSAVDLPPTRQQPLEAQHPAIRQLRYFFHNDEPLDDATERLALCCYYGLVSFTDHLVGRMLDVIDNSRLKDNTVVIYTSDHGEMAGHHGIWQKQCFYENAVRVPIVMRGPAIPAGLRVRDNVSLVDMLPSLLELGGQRPYEPLPGRSLLGFMDDPQALRRTVFSEYHAQGFLDAGFMLKRGAHKLNWYVGHAPELYDLDADPQEVHDLSQVPSCADLRKDLEAELFRRIDPTDVNRRAKRNQELRGTDRANPNLRGR